MIANSIFAGDYLTTEGQPASTDLKMIAVPRSIVEGADEKTLPLDRDEVARGDVSCVSAAPAPNSPPTPDR